MIAHSELRKKMGSSSSRLYGMLPIGVQIHLPLISSLRRSFSACAVCTQQYQSESGNHCQSRSMGLGYVEEESKIESVEEESKIESLSSELAPEALRPRSRSIDAAWKHANQGDICVFECSKTAHLTDSAGLILLGNAMSEAQTSDPRNQAFSRRTYINSLTYLLQALPPDLNEVEILYLQQSFPKAIQTNPYTAQNPIQPTRSRPPRSALHRILAAFILQAFLLFHILLPYIKSFLRSVHRYDREHQVSERVAATIIDTGDRFRKRGVDVACLLLSVKVGTLGFVLSWLVEGISGGIYEGVGEGMSIIRTREQELEILKMRKDWNGSE